ncbi:serine hydrolase domain-containing protein [Spirosoma sordidisoli]|nr:serine hydrolase domain-containing protein [Spirosoma sordidisoli]
MKLKISSIQSILFILLWIPSLAQSRLSQLQKALPSMMDSTGISGLSVALIENGKVTWSSGLGIKNKGTKEPVSTQTIFRGASLGKPLFAYAVLKLSEQRKIALDTPLVSYAPPSYLETHFLKSPLGDERIRLITARMVLNHTSGLPNWRAEGKPLTTMFMPGSRYSYSGEGYYLLQTVVEYLVKESVESFMQRTVFKPMAMTHTSYMYHAVDSLRYASSYDMTGKCIADEQETVNVAHTLRTTADDYARFIVAAMMKPGSGEQTAKALLSSLVKTDICQPGQVSWGLGFAVQHTVNGNLFCQWAKSPTASGYVIGSTDHKTAVVYFVNVANQGLRIAERMVKLGLDYDDPLFSCFGVRPYNARR